MSALPEDAPSTTAAGAPRDIACDEPAVKRSPVAPSDFEEAADIVSSLQGDLIWKTCKQHVTQHDQSSSWVSWRLVVIQALTHALAQRTKLKTDG